MFNQIDLPVERLTGLSLVTGVTVAGVLRELGGIDCQLKWPNDVIVDDAKLAGLLIEVPRGSATYSNVVTGIGINFKSVENPGEITQKIISVTELCNNPPSRNEIIGKILGRLKNNFFDYKQNGLKNFTAIWRELDYLHGKSVRIVQGDAELEGIAQGLSESGELLVRIDDKLRTFHSGDVSVRRQ